MDVDNIPLGENFQSYIASWIEKSDIILVVIGPNWLSTRNADGQRRLDDPSDFVRIEVASALSLGKTVIPVLVRGATMPDENSLPNDMKALAYRNAARINQESFVSDTRRLADSLTASISSRASSLKLEGWSGSAVPWLAVLSPVATMVILAFAMSTVGATIKAADIGGVPGEKVVALIGVLFGIASWYAVLKFVPNVSFAARASGAVMMTVAVFIVLVAR